MSLKLALNPRKAANAAQAAVMFRRDAAMKLRNPLFAPADSERKVAKALATSADAVILDLEDSVAPAAKDAARSAATTLLTAGPARPGLIVRVNPRDTTWYLRDLAAVVPGRPAAILLPKCTGSADLQALDHHLEVLEAASGLPVGDIGVLALVTETAASLRNMDYAGVTSRLRALAFGAEDLAADLGISPRDGEGLLNAPIAAARAGRAGCRRSGAGSRHRHTLARSSQSGWAGNGDRGSRARRVCR
jgi:citrate lyase subunit beta/citryl-CoA lyase